MNKARQFILFMLRPHRTMVKSRNQMAGAVVLMAFNMVPAYLASWELFLVMLICNSIVFWVCLIGIELRVSVRRGELEMKRCDRSLPFFSRQLYYRTRRVAQEVRSHNSQEGNVCQ